MSLCAQSLWAPLHLGLSLMRRGIEAKSGSSQLPFLGPLLVHPEPLNIAALVGCTWPIFSVSFLKVSGGL